MSYRLYSIINKDPLEHYVYPEELFTDIMSIFLDIEVKKKYDTDGQILDDPFGHFPSMIANNSYIARENIIAYFKETTNINEWLTVPQARTLEWYEHLIMTKLHLVTRITLLAQQEKVAYSIFSFIHSPIRTFFKYHHLNNFINCCSSTIGCSTSHNIQCYDLSREVYEKLSKISLTTPFLTLIRRKIRR